MKPYLILIVTLLLVSCNRTKNDSSSDCLKVQLTENHYINTSDLFLDKEVISLETNKNCLIAEVSRMQVVKDFIFILDKKQHQLLKFSSGGKYITKLDKKGKGANEYLSINDFFVKDSAIFVLSRDSKKIMKLSLDFEFIEEIMLDSYYYSMFPKIGSDLIYLYSNFSSSLLKNVSVLDCSKKAIVNKFKPFLEQQLGQGYDNIPFMDLNGVIGMIFPYDYTIYEIVNDSLIEKYKFNFGEDNTYPEEVQLYTSEQIEQYNLSQGYGMLDRPISSIKYPFMVDNKLVFTVVYSGLSNIVVYDLFKNQSRTGSLLNDHGSSFSISNFKCKYDEWLYATVNPEDYYTDKTEVDDETWLMSSNPIIISYKLKDDIFQN